MMAPYYQDELVTIYLGDCRDIVTSIGFPRVDVVVADPPTEQTELEWDVWPLAWVEVVSSVVRVSGSQWVFGSLRTFIDHRDAFLGLKLAQEIVWEKHNGSNFHNDRFRRVHELVAQFYSDNTTWAQVYKNPQFTMDATKRTVRRKGKPAHMGHIDGGKYESEDGGPRLQRSVLFVRSAHGYAIHPTQKPVGIILPLLNYSCPPGGLVLDPFAGSLSTAVAAKQLGMRCIAIDTNEQMLAEGIRRLEFMKASEYAGAE